jgi:hypothetical protein
VPKWALLVELLDPLDGLPTLNLNQMVREVVRKAGVAKACVFLLNKLKWMCVPKYAML